MVYVVLEDGSVDVDGTRRRVQYDNGTAAGAPPTFQPVQEPVRRESAPGGTLLPRLGGGSLPILIAAPGITPNAPKEGEGGYADTSKPPFGAPAPLAPSAMPVLRAADDTPSPATVATGVDWRWVAAGTAVLVLVWFLITGDDDK